MNRRVIAATALAILLLTLCSCGKKNAEEKTAQESTAEATVATTEALIPGVEANDFSAEDFALEPTETEGNDDRTTTDATTPKPTTPKATEPKATEPSATKPTEPAPTTPQNKPTGEEGVEDNDFGYDAYMEMSGEDQKAFIDSFDSMEEFFNWLNSAREEDAEKNDVIIVGDGTVDLGAIGGK